jgi:hypothetical protein
MTLNFHSRRLLSLALLGAVSMTAAACGSNGTIEAKGEISTTTDASSNGAGGGTDDVSADEQDVADYLIGDGTSAIVSVSAATCVARAVAPDLSKEGQAIVVAGGDFDLAEFSETDAASIVRATDECVPLKDMAASFSENLTSDDTFPVSDTEATCIADEFSKNFSGSGDFLNAVSTGMSDDQSGAMLLASMKGCLSDESAAKIISSIVAESGMDASVADCVGTAVISSIGADAAIEGILSAGTGSTSGDAGAAFTEALTAAATTCGAGAGAAGTSGTAN